MSSPGQFIPKLAAYLAAWITVLGLTFDASSADPGTLVLAHYMPWYQAKPANPKWGWHWTMNHFDPDQQQDGRREIASHYYPLIGPYDSGDSDVIEYHLLLIKLAGIDGVIVDWYGREDFRDYTSLHRNTQKLILQAERMGLRFVICYEDQTIPALVAANRIAPEARVDHAAQEIRWLAENWFTLNGYVKFDGKPLLLSFGQTGLSDAEWTECLATVRSPLAYISQHKRRTPAAGAFDWPVPSRGVAAVDEFTEKSRAWPLSIPVAFPRFIDIYAEANVHKSWGRIEDRQGETLRETFSRALDVDTPIIQIATWNDWGEGTSIEPSRELGYRDLEMIQQMIHETTKPDRPATREDLRLPRKLLRRRRKRDDDNLPRETVERLDAVARMLSGTDLDQAREILNSED